jgi:FdhE protein
MAELATANRPWLARRRRAEELLRRYQFAGEQLALFAALLDVQERIYDEVLASPPPVEKVLSLLINRSLPGVVEATMRSGPEKLRAATVDRLHSADLEDLFGRWLRSQEQAPVDRYLARASLAPVLEAAPWLGRVCEGPRDQLHCPNCGGLPQVSYLSRSEEALVSGPRLLMCSRCLCTWVYPRSACAACGERSTSRLRILAEDEEPVFAHIRVDACDHCNRYLLSIDLRTDASALPEVDELAATPLDLYARDHGMTKVVPNLMGF